MNKKNNKMRNRLLAFSLAFALCMGAFAGFTMTTHAASNAYNTLRASVKRVNTVLGDIYEFDGYTDETIYPLLDQLSESEWTTLKNETTIDGVSPLDRYGTSKANYDTNRYYDTHPSDEANPANQNTPDSGSNNGNANNSQSSSDSSSNTDETISTESASEAAKATGFPGAKTRLTVGTTFKVVASGATYRVTKQASYRQLGEVELIKWEGYDNYATPYEEPYRQYYYYGPHMGFSPIGIDFTELSAYIDDPGKNPYDKHDKKKWKDWNANAYRYSSKGQNMSAMMLKMFAVYSEMNNNSSTNPDGTLDFNTIDEVFVITSIAPKVFKGSNVNRAMIPDSVTTIPAGCFQDCKNLEEVWWGSNCLKDLKSDDVLSKSLPSYKAKKTIKAGAFKGCTKLKAFNLTGLYAKLTVSKNAFKKDKKEIKVNSYNKNKYVKQFAKDIHNKGKSKKDKKIKNGVSVPDNVSFPDSSSGDVKIKAKKSSKKKK